MLKLMCFVNGKYFNQHWGRRNVTSASTDVKCIGALNSFTLYIISSSSLSPLWVSIVFIFSRVQVPYLWNRQPDNVLKATANLRQVLIISILRWIFEKIYNKKNTVTQADYFNDKMTYFLFLPLQAENFLAARIGIISIVWFRVTFLPLSRANPVSLPNYASDPLRWV